MPNDKSMGEFLKKNKEKQILNKDKKKDEEEFYVDKSGKMKISKRGAESLKKAFSGGDSSY